MRGYWLRSWPLLIAAVAAFVAGTTLLSSPEARELAAAALLVVGAVCLGAWIAQLSSHDYPGRETMRDASDDTHDDARD